MGLSDIQKKINDDFGIVMTYMDVRFLVDDLDLDLIDEEEEVVEEDDSEVEGETKRARQLMTHLMAMLLVEFR